ncbi:SDR family NAD(P)-dependent oxidoreductase [Amycolatopsis cihanbeyliensis]|uniref:NAD(P)-dependent dehydrogenase (Short-subunit alcohol dehydrogenase family) n=1 Tax=Amycolatopsis cihanbeyliensis TaxID=1128664 RepID=A0A542CSJ0_AMYCI|nr:SDR family NAD(P)-dependent oxidoreductase [Amycolatopsis cihanbeyliensis]TQI93783.1 NAD(P)-dependent dehydrogenase (short-subunit alcohol dehydrogenase family) [Amycolatopsis cihanbeyliensis]
MGSSPADTIPPERLAGKVAVITGAGTGIGAATARRFAAEGAAVVLTGRREEPLHAAAEGLGERALCVPADVTDAAAVRGVRDAALDRFGGLDIVVANAGGHGVGAATDVDDAAWQRGLQANLNSAFVTARETLPELRSRHGCMVMVSSIAGLAAAPEMCGYVTAKHALIGLTRSLARDYGKDGVRVNALCPGWVRTPMADAEMDELGRLHGIGRQEAYRLATKDTPLGRPAEPEEIASIIAFLGSADSAVMTGTVLVADAGAGAVDLPTLAFTP